jgi:hypothetical protein
VFRELGAAQLQGFDALLLMIEILAQLADGLLLVRELLLQSCQSFVAHEPPVGHEMRGLLV